MLWKKNLNVLVLSQTICIMSFGFGIPFLPYFIQDLGVKDKATIDLYAGLLMFLPMFTMAVMAPVWGHLSDKFGKKAMLQRSMFFASISLLAMAFAQDAQQLLVLRFIQGIFTGSVAAAASFVGTYTPKEHISTALGTLSSANALGNAFGPALGGMVADATGYRTSFIIGGLLMFLALIIVTTMLVEKKESLSNQEQKVLDIKPEINTNTQIKSKPDEIIDTDIPLCDIEIIDNSDILSKELKTQDKTIDTEVKNKELEKDKYEIRDYMFLLMMSLTRMANAIFVPTLPLYIPVLLKTNSNLASINGFVNLFSGIAVALAGITIVRLADGRNKEQMNSYLLFAIIGISTLAFFSSNFYVFATLYVLIRFLFGGLEPLTVSSCVEKTSIKNKGTFFGYQAMAQNTGTMLAPLLGTYISINFGYNYVLLTIPFLSLAIYFVNTQISQLKIRS